MKNNDRLDQSRSAIGRMTRSAIGRASGRLTSWVGSSASLQAAGRFLRGQLWAWPIVAAVLFGGAGWLVYWSVTSAMRQQRINGLTTVLEADLAALRVWMQD